MKRLSAPVDIQLELTEACNQKCLHCYNYWRYLDCPRHEELSLADFSAILDQARECGVHLITLTGGEPLIRKNILFPLVRKARSCGFEVGLNSNATSLDHESAEELKGAGLDHALISLLGTEHTHDTIAGLKGGFQRTITGIGNLLSVGIPVSVNMVVSKTNLGEVFAVATMLRDIGVKSFCGTPVVPSNRKNIPMMLSPAECKTMLRTLSRAGRELGLRVDVLEPVARCLFSEEEEDEFIRFFYQRNCAAAVMSCAISSTGYMRPCIHSDVVFGNVLQEGLSAVWHKMDPWTSHKILPQDCHSCAAVVICEGGCRMAAKLINGAYDAKDMYMTGPIHDLERIHKLPHGKGGGEDISAKTMLRRNLSCKVRKEEFGYVVMSDGGVYFITEAAHDFVEYLESLCSFSIESLVLAGHIEGDVSQAIKDLWTANILERERR